MHIFHINLKSKINTVINIHHGLVKLIPSDLYKLPNDSFHNNNVPLNNIIITILHINTHNLVKRGQIIKRAN